MFKKTQLIDERASSVLTTSIMVIWPSGKATVCKTVIAGSIPVITLIKKVANMATFFYVVNAVKVALVY